MKKEGVLILLLGVIIGANITYYVNDADAWFTNIPPTPAFRWVIINGDTYEAKSHNDVLIMNSTGDLDLTITGNAVSVQMKQKQCAILQAITGIDANGNFVCAIP